MNIRLQCFDKVFGQLIELVICRLVRTSRRRVQCHEKLLENGVRVRCLDSRRQHLKGQILLEFAAHKCQCRIRALHGLGHLFIALAYSHLCELVAEKRRDQLVQPSERIDQLFLLGWRKLADGRDVTALGFALLNSVFDRLFGAHLELGHVFLDNRVKVVLAYFFAGIRQRNHVLLGVNHFECLVLFQSRNAVFFSIQNWISHFDWALIFPPPRNKGVISFDCESKY